MIQIFTASMVVIVSILGCFSAHPPPKEQPMLTSWNVTNITFKIPKNYNGAVVPIISFQVLRHKEVNQFENRDELELCEQDKTIKKKIDKRETPQEKRKEAKKKRPKPVLSGVVGGNLRSEGADEGPKSSRFQLHKYPTHKDKEMTKHEWQGGGVGSHSNNKKKHHLLHRGDLFELAGKNRFLFVVTFDPGTGMASLHFKRDLKETDYVKPHSSYLEVKISGRSGSENGCVKFSPLFDVKLNIIEPFNCDHPHESMCLLPEGDMRIQQWENEPPGSLFVLPSLISLCPDLTRIIDINMLDIDDKDNFELEYISSHGSIDTTRSLDRELRDSHLKFQLTCIIKTSNEVIMKKNKTSGVLLVKDVDDSAPIRVKSQRVMWNVTEPRESLEMDEQMMVVDPDLEEQHDYIVELRGNHMGLIEINMDQHHHFPQVPVEHCAKLTGILERPLTAECTVLTPHITFSNQFVKWYPDDGFNFSLAFIDKSLVGPKDKQNEVQFDVTVNLKGLKNPKAYHLETMLPSMDEVEFTPETNISLPKPLRKFTRITQMLHPTSYTEYDKMDKLNNTYYLAPTYQKYGVEVTTILGILYISEPDTLTYILETKGVVEIILMQGNNNTKSIFLEFSNNFNTCKNKPTNPPLIRTNGSSCARHKYRNECEESCSYGSLAARCSWRDYNGTWMSPHFATCSPDLFTCPDGICDELEQMNNEICPQDCVEENSIKQGQNLELNSGQGTHPKRGILKGFGVCSCDDYCQCFPAGSEHVKTPRQIREKVRNQSLEGDSCGAACQVGLSIGILLAIFFIVIIFCRRRKDCSGKYKDGELGRSPFPSDYAEDHSSSYGPPHGEAHAVALHSVHNFHHNSPRPNSFNNNNNNQDMMADFPLENVSIDIKWEFPRNQLIIEQTLGEGEFGKVSKAKANGIGGQPGCTVVAVKMLKRHSTAAELADLLSEYDLLKEVSHPNVVKLLGACTTKGGPIYLIIEFCKYGSLRSYLRRSRHFELESRVGSAPMEESPGDYQVTPKQLLSFAWQICKGMDYLGNMKLVHRDLAARNVLLAEGKTCKISDFGLTRDVYEGDLYFKRSKSRVPVKWMAIESLVDHVYTSKSDIWGFGVLLWELVNLGSSPYPGVTPERLFTLLQSGYRMEKPENCSVDLYKVMRSCWHENPHRRPTFAELTQTFDRMIEANVEYLELRSLIVTNREYFDDSLATTETQNIFLPTVQVKETSPSSIAKQSTHSNEDFEDTTAVDKDSYLLARSSLTVNPSEERRTSTEPLLPAVSPVVASHMTSNGTHMHAHNPAYSPSSDDLPPILQTIPPTLLQYTSLANGPDEEEDVGIVVEEGQDCCRSEADSDSGRATGDSGYITEEGRKSRVSRNASVPPHTFGKPLSSSRGSRGSYSPLTPHGMEDEQDTFEDFEERQDLIAEDIMLISAGTFTPSPPNSTRIDITLTPNEGDTVLPPPSTSFSTSSTPSGTSIDGICNGQLQTQLPQRSRRNPVQV